MDVQAFHGVPSGDGSRVAFTAYMNVTPATAQIYLRDLRRGTTRIVDKASNGICPTPQCTARRSRWTAAS